MKRVNLYLPCVQINQLKRLRQQTGLSVSEHVRRAIDYYLKEVIRHEMVDK